MQPGGDAARVEAEGVTSGTPEAMTEIQAEKCDVGMDVIKANSGYTRTDLHQASGRVSAPWCRTYSLKQRRAAPSAMRLRA